MKGKYELQIFVSPPNPDFEIPVLKTGVDNVEIPTKFPPDMKTEKIPQSVEFFEEDGIQKAIHTTPLGKQKVDHVVCSNYSVSWEAFSGSEGVELFHFVMILSECTDHTLGICAGTKPFFRGYLNFQGKRVSD